MKTKIPTILLLAASVVYSAPPDAVISVSGKTITDGHIIDGSVDGTKDGNGSDGCIVSSGRHVELYEILKSIMLIMRVLPVEVGITL